MTRRLVVRPRARLELADAIDWYDEQRPGWGETFFNSFMAAAGAIAENPLQYQMVGTRARCAGLRGFPHGLIYEVTDNGRDSGLLSSKPKSGVMAELTRIPR